MIPQIPEQPRRPPSRLAQHIYRFRVFATRHSFTLIYVWAGVMLVGLGLLHYDVNVQGKRLRCEDKQYHTRYSNVMLS